MAEKPAQAKKPGGRSRRSSARTRRAALRVREPDLGDRLRLTVQSGPFGWAVLTCAAFVICATALVLWTRAQPLVAVERIMDETRSVRVGFSVEDEAETQSKRDLARQQTPRVFVADEAELDEIRSSLENLPVSVESAETLDEVERGIREQFGLTEAGLAALRAEAGTLEAWRGQVARVVALLRERPLLTAQAWQRAVQEGSNARVELRVGPDRVRVPRTAVVNIEDASAIEELANALARRAGFDGETRGVVAARLMGDPRQTYRYDAAATTGAQNEAASAVEAQVREVPAGTPIYSRGDRLTSQQLELHRDELAAFSRTRSGLASWAERAGVLVAVGGVTLAGAAYVAAYLPRVRRNPTRMAGLAMLTGAALAVSCVGSVVNPQLMTQTATAPALFAAVILAIAYSRRVAIAIGVLLVLLVSVALRLSIGETGAVLAGVCTAAWRLSDVRERRSLVTMSIWTAIALALATGVAGALERPLNPATGYEILLDALLTGLGGIVIGAVTLFVLPLVERAFDITTGMTLIELRDPKQPLLRRLQQRAPGTYNHSLNVASIAEAASDAIGADALRTYVGALYHDVGKMNKPEYFVENQSGGPNKHDKLSPAMSLLVIVGHVKDGMEIAKEYGLPRPLLHFVEGHHGTTLVEYFYQRARKTAEQAIEDTRAEGAGKGEQVPEPEVPEEVEYRYPGPKPRTKECAMLMLADAVESATRTLAEPTPARIDQLVRSIARKRLEDGQFDDCDLTLKELHVASESISKTVAAIYHGRIVYPSGPSSKEDTKDTPKAARAT